MSRRAWVEQVMGLPVSIHLRGPDIADADVQRAVAATFTELRRMDELFSTWQPGSHVSRLRSGELAWSDCDPIVGEAARIGELACRRTGGAFTTWLPDASGVPRFDPTGLVKGWAVDRAAAALAALPAVSWCINAGGDVLAGRHRHVPPTGADAAPWRVGVEDPHDRTRIVRVVPLTAGAVATSGTAARGAHLYDPFSRQPVSRAGSTTVVGTDLLWADIWATALFVGGEAARAAFEREAPDCQVVDL
ncbi:MAG: FAD:protein FMN transferase [Dermatophilaceae bacterium]